MFTDFQYGDELASDYGLYVVKFDSSSGGSETISSGSTLTFNTVKSVGQDISELYGSTYDEDYPFTIQLCRLDNHCNPIPLMPEEYGAINRWLNRKYYEEFKINKEGYENIRFYGSFNIPAIKINDEIYGIECTFNSNAPYAFAKERTHTFSNVKSFYIYDDSDEVGEIYPYTVITCNEAGNLTITNSADNELCIMTVMKDLVSLTIAMAQNLRPSVVNMGNFKLMCHKIAKVHLNHRYFQNARKISLRLMIRLLLCMRKE